MLIKISPDLNKPDAVRKRFVGICVKEGIVSRYVMKIGSKSNQQEE